MKKYFQIILLAYLSISCAYNPNQQNELPGPVNFVDPMIGSDFQGHVFVGANVPFGAVQTGPDNYYKGWQWCSGYYYPDSIITGFSQMHLSGTGIGELGDILITPYTGDLKTSPGSIESPLAGYASLYKHSDEIAMPGYYSVILRNYDIQVELTATKRVAVHRYTFPQAEQAHIAINLEHGVGMDKPVKTFIKKVDEVTYTGYRFSTGWVSDQRVYFAIRTSRPLGAIHLYENGEKTDDGKNDSNKLVADLQFSTSQKERIILKVGISPLSEKKALENLREEVPGWDFDEIASKAGILWNQELGKIQISSNNQKEKTIFYTALYHTYIDPVLFNDQDGAYWGADKKAHAFTGFQNYSAFSLWDTYRAVHPLYTIIQPERVNDFINTMLSIYKTQGKLPVWHLMGNETDCMVGNPSIPIITDAVFKGFTGFDPDVAFKAMKSSAMQDDKGLIYVKRKSFIPADLEKESVSKALEYCFSDWCIAQMAKRLKAINDYDEYTMRSELFKQYFDAETKFFRPRLKNGEFRNPFSPFIWDKPWRDYTEGNAWQYIWMVPHNVESLIQLLGGEKNFTQKLDSLFTLTFDTGVKEVWDISGCIGQYAHGNELSHHIAYLYAYAGQQWKTAEKVRYILKNLYTTSPDGLCGNDDCGQMSAWYVFSALGFYPVNPANACFVFGSPLFDEAVIKLPKGKLFRIITHHNNSNNIYIQSVKLNGAYYSKSFLHYKDIMAGGYIEFEMGDRPNLKFGSDLKDRPKSAIETN